MRTRGTALGRLWIATFFLYSATGSMYPMFSLYMSYNGLTPSQVGLVISISTLASILPIATIGRVSDLFGRKRVQAGLGGALTVLAPLYVAATSLVEFLVLQSAFAILAYSYMTLSGAAAMDFIASIRGAGFAKFRTSGALGWILGTLLSGLTSDRIGFHAAFLESSLLFLISAALFAAGSRPVGHRSMRTPWRAQGKTFLNRRIYAMLVAIFIASLTTPAYYTFLPLFMTSQLGASTFYSSLAFTITPLAEVPAMIYLGALSDRMGRDKVIVLCLATYPMRYLLTISSGNPLLVIAVQLLHGLTFGGLYVVATVYLSETAPEDFKGFVLSLYTVFMNLGGFIGGYLLGAVAEELGFYVLYTLAAAISSLSTPIFYALSRSRR